MTRRQRAVHAVFVPLLFVLLALLVLVLRAGAVPHS
jgi:hypothetical protein